MLNFDISIVTHDRATRGRSFTWSARCKSGYEFNGKVCTRFTARHALLCTDCASAVVINEARPSLLASVAAFFARPLFGGSN